MIVSELSEHQWLDAWSALPQDRREVYFHPRYAALCARWEHATPHALCVRTASGLALYPFLAHPITGFHRVTTRHDAQTAYGYGGPLFVGEWSADEHARALQLFATELATRGAVAEFIRCHPEWCNAERLAAQGFRAAVVRTNVEHELSGPDAGVPAWSDSVRRNLRRSQRDGLTHREGSTDADWAAFERLYAATADRLAMADMYRFDAHYFASLRRVPGVSLVCVDHPTAGTVAAAVLFAGPTRLAFYHLGASDLNHQSSRPNDRLYQAMAESARAAGCQRIVWGGGMSNDPSDSLFRFKTGFGQLRRPVHVACRVLDQPAFDALADEWAQRNPAKAAGRRLMLCYRG